MDVKASDQCSVPPSLHVDLKVSRPRPFLLSSLANTLLGVAHHTYRVPSAKGYAVPKGFPSGTYRVPSARSRALRSAPGALHGRRRAYGASPADSLPAGHCGAPRAPSYVGGGRRAAGATPAWLLASPRAPRPARAPRLLASPGRRAPCPRLARPLRLALCAAAGVASRRAAGLGGFAPAPRLPPNGSARFPAKAGCPPVRFGLRSRCAQPTQPAGSYRVPKGFLLVSCGSLSFAGAPWLGLRPALHFRPLRSATLTELVKRPPPFHFGGLWPPTAARLIPSALCTYRVGWGCASLVIRSCPHYRSIPSSFGLVCSGLPPVLFVWRRRVRLFEPWPTLRPSARVPLPVPPLGRGPNSPPSFPRSLRSRPPFGRATGRAVETFFVGYAQPVPNVACVCCASTTSWAEQELWHPTKAVPTVPSSLSAPLLWGRVGEAVQEWTHVDQCCVPSSLHVDLRVSIPAPPLYCLRLPRLLVSPRRLRRSTSAAATFCHCLRSAHLFRSMAGGFSNCVVDV